MTWGKQRPGAHRVADVQFSAGQRSDAAPLMCSCGWAGTVAEWREHRQSVGCRAVAPMFPVQPARPTFDPDAPTIALPFGVEP